MQNLIVAHQRFEALKHELEQPLTGDLAQERGTDEDVADDLLFESSRSISSNWLGVNKASARLKAAQPMGALRPITSPS